MRNPTLFLSPSLSLSLSHSVSLSLSLSLSLSHSLSLTLSVSLSLSPSLSLSLIGIGHLGKGTGFGAQQTQSVRQRRYATLSLLNREESKHCQHIQIVVVLSDGSQTARRRIMYQDPPQYILSVTPTHNQHHLTSTKYSYPYIGGAPLGYGCAHAIVLSKIKEALGLDQVHRTSTPSLL